MKLPKKIHLYSLCQSTKKFIDDEFRAFEGDDLPGIQLTVGWNSETGEWGWQIGDNSYTGGAYHYPTWAVIGVYRSSNCAALTVEILNQLEEQAL